MYAPCVIPNAASLSSLQRLELCTAYQIYPGPFVDLPDQQGDPTQHSGIFENTHIPGIPSSWHPDMMNREQQDHSKIMMIPM